MPLVYTEFSHLPQGMDLEVEDKNDSKSYLQAWALTTSLGNLFHYPHGKEPAPNMQSKPALF